ncbi:MAG: hypothetical protein HYX24_06995 [Candidatus Aenigmarchaeota archaeon]|nr:hypothetical protein [Candidatus Aenigmarchaeota archaeon]
MPESFVQQVLREAQSYAWIQRIERQTVGKVARLRLFLDKNRFIAVYYNGQTGSISYAYIENEQRLFGANNMRIGWHIHPYGKEGIHIESRPIAIGEFLHLLEKELQRQKKIV